MRRLQSLHRKKTLTIHFNKSLILSTPLIAYRHQQLYKSRCYCKAMQRGLLIMIMIKIILITIVALVVCTLLCGAIAVIAMQTQRMDIDD